MQIIKVVATIIAFIFMYLILEIIKRKSSIETEITRKIVHIISGLSAILVSMYLSYFQFIFVCLFFLLFFSVNLAKKFLKSITIECRKTYGELAYPLGILVLYLFMFNHFKYFVLGMLILSVPDSLAGLTGFFRSSNRKTIYGSLIYLISSFGILAFSGNTYFALLTAVVLTIVEYFTPLGLDNLSVPVVYTIIYAFILR